MIASRSSLDDALGLTISAHRDGRRYFPCSQAQERFWFEEQLHPGNPGLNVAVRWRLEGDVSASTIERAWDLLLARHASLRTFFELTRDGDPIQVVEPDIDFSIPVVDLRALSAGAALAEADRLAESEARTAFDLSRAPLVRVTLLRVNEAAWIVLVTAHHIVCDGWSVGILAQEMGAACAAIQAGHPPDLAQLPLTYGEYASAERAWLASNAFSEELAFSRRLLEGYKQFELVPDRPRPPVQTSNGDIATILLERTLTASFVGLARAHGCTFFMTALAALVALLHRYSGETDITLGSQVVGRDEVDVEGIVGCFINTIALRCDVSGDPTFLELLERTRDTVMDTLEVRHLPLERLIEIVNPKRDLSRNALFSVNFIFQRSFIKNERYGSFRLIDLPSRSAGALYDLNFFMVERPEGWRASCEFNADLFDRATVERMMQHFNTLLGAVAADPALSISTVPILSEAERHELVVERNHTAAAYPGERCVPQLVAAQARRNGGAVALVCGLQSLTYAELDAAASRLATTLRVRGLAPKTHIGVFLDRSPELVIALLAVQKAGSAYVPLDPTYPPDRIAFIQSDAQLAALVTRSNLVPRLGESSAPYVFVDDAAPERRYDPGPEPAIVPDDVAYVIYTSGSTGHPKGVQIQHRALVNFLCAMREQPGLTERDVLVAPTTVSFDIAGLELYLPLITGARLVIAKEEEVVDGSALLALLRRHNATVMQATPVTWQLLIDAGWNGDPALKMLCGGEALSRSLASRLLACGDELWNMYGPTETTIWSAALAVRPGDGPVPIGGPIANTQFYVLDTRGQLLPPGVPGELCIGGDGVALGYLNRADLTRERFVPDPFRDGGAKLYRTGDVVRSRGPGRLEFLGRADNQIKLRGFRIELGEIESALMRQADVAEAVAVIGPDALNEPSIWAYVVPRGTNTQPSDDWPAVLRAELGRFLPSFMVPSPIMVLPELPRTPNGKVDRGGLPDPRAAQPPAPTAIDMPRGDTETRIEALIGELLGYERIGRTGDIFALGFHSLLAVRLVARIASAFGVKLPLRTLFDHSTVAALAARIDDARSGTHAPTGPAVIASINLDGPRRPFFFLHSDVLSDGLYCRRLTVATGPLQPFHCVAPHGTAGLERLTNIEAMARDYVGRIRSVQPAGPYRLGGFCAGGLVAYELAQLLRAQGEEIEALILINASAPARRAVLAGDAIIRRIGRDERLAPGLRESLCYYVARLHDALGNGPRAMLRFATRLLGAIFARAASNGGAALEPQPFDKRSGSLETENYFAQLAAALTYHPLPYDGTLTLIWGTEQIPPTADPTMGWGQLVRRVDFRPMTGGHVSPLHDRIDELGRVLDELLSR